MFKAALITGGARRIGAEIVKFLAKLGYNIALHYNTSKENAKKIKEEVESVGVKCKLFQCDLSEEKKALKLLNDVKKEFPELILLINNASIFIRSKIKETDSDAFNKIFNINFKAPYILSRDFAKIINKGNVINIIDTKINNNDYIYAAYTLSKKILADFTLMAAKEFAPNIRVNAIAPGIILPPAGKTEEYLKNIIKKVPLKKRGETEDIIKALEFLLNNEYITGQIIYVSGGQHL